MADKPAAQVAVGPEFELVYAWPSITPAEWDKAAPALIDSLGDTTDTVLAHEIQSKVPRSIIKIARSALGEKGSGKHLFDMTEGIAKAFGRKEIRYGRVGQHALAGVSEELSEAERKVFDDNYLYQNRVLELFPLDHIPVNDDGSQTFAYRTDIYKSDKLKRLRERIISEIAPHLGGMVLTVKPMVIASGDPASLFHPKHR